MSRKLSALSYTDVRKAYESGQKLHLADGIYLVRPVPRDAREGLVFWVTHERSLGDHGLLFFSDGRVEAKEVR